MRDIKLKSAVAADLPIVAALAKKTWNQYYPAIISTDQINYMLNLMYSPESLLEQLDKKGHLFYLITENEKNIGFISVNKEKDNEWFINKFYINQEEAAKGIGSSAFELLKKEIQPSIIRLTVNRKNYKSINFYFKNGFKIEKVADFDIGNGFVMNDFVMVWEDKV